MSETISFSEYVLFVLGLSGGPEYKNKKQKDIYNERNAETKIQCL